MRVLLQPLKKQVPPITVTEALVTLGRNEQIFDDFDKSELARLSRRHAKLFEQDDEIYVADLNSRNGTFVNGDRVDAVPRCLRHGDVLEIGRLGFRVELDESVPTQIEPEVKVFLEPLTAQNNLLPVVITRFPFLVQRDGELFDPYRERAAQQVDFISAKHAHFYLQQGDVCLEDLDSTNGTLCNGEVLNESAVVLKTGDTVSFGGDFFEYRVQILRPDDSQDRTTLATLDHEQQESGTIFVDSPSSLVDIYDTRDRVQGSGPVPEEAEPNKEADKPRAKERPPKPQKEARKARGQSSRWWRSVLFLLAIIGVAGAAWYYATSGPSTEELERRFYDGDYAGAEQIAIELLEQGNLDRGSRRLATVVSLRVHLPLWLAAYNQQDTQRAQSIVELLSSRAQLLPELQDISQLLQWVYEARWMDADSESERNRLRAWWIADPARRHRALNTLTGYAPSAQTIRDSVLEQLRKMELE